MQEFVPKKWPITLVFMGMEEKDPELNVSQWMAFLIVFSFVQSQLPLQIPKHMMIFVLPFESHNSAGMFFSCKFSLSARRTYVKNEMAFVIER